MRLTRLKTTNFKKLRGEHVWDFSDGIVGIVGHNGRGKSTIMNAVAWTLYGPEAIPGTKANVISWGENSTSVSVEIMIDDKPYMVIRSQKASGAGDAFLLTGPKGGTVMDQELAHGLDPTTRAVQELLGVDRTGFLISVYSRQEELAGLSSLTPSLRMKTVMRLRGIAKIEDAIESVRSQSREQKRSLAIIRTIGRSAESFRQKIKILQDEMLALSSSQAGAAGSSQELNASITNLEMRERELAAQVQSYRTYRDAYDRADHDVRWQRRALRAAETAATAPPPPDPGEPPPRPEATALLRLMTERSQHALTLETTTKSLTGTGTTCPCCDRPYDNAEEIEAHRVDLQREYWIARVATRDLDMRIGHNIRKTEGYEAWQKSHDQWQKWSNRNGEVEEELSALRSELEAAIRTRDSMEEVFDCSGELNDVRDYLKSYRSQQADLRVQVATLDERQRATTVALEQAEADLGEAEKHEAEAKMLERETVALDVTVKELVTMKESLVGQMIPALNAAASRFLSEMTDGRYSELRLTPDYEMQYANDLGQWQPFETLSGGEQDVFALALRLALSEISAERIGVLFLDEIVESLDPDRQEAMWNTLVRLTKRYEQIFLVTHVPEFKERAPQTITL